jgi:hypothetical protein
MRTARVLGSYALLSLIVACSSASGSSTPAPSDAGAPTDAATADDDAAHSRSPCPEGSRESGDTCETTFAFTKTKGTLLPARDHHTTHVFDVGGAPYLYVFGGTPSWSTIFDDIQRATIAPDGSLSGFTPAGTLPHPRAGHMAVRVKDKIIVVGGSSMHGDSPSSMFISDTVDVGTLEPDGMVDAWVDGPTMPEGVMHHLIAVKGDWLFVFGGRAESTGASIDQVLRSKLAADGAPGPFESLSPLPEARSHAMGFQDGDSFYMAGGITGDPVGAPPNREDVVRTRLGDDGSVGAWEQVAKLPPGGLSVTAAQVFARHVYMLGGMASGSAYTKNVYRAAINADGSLGPFTILPVKLPTARAHVHQTPMFGRTLYSIGGQLANEESLDEVVVGTFTAP